MIMLLFLLILMDLCSDPFKTGAHSLKHVISLNFVFAI